MSPVQKSRIKPNHYRRPGPTGNTCGIVCPKTETGPLGGNARPPVTAETTEEKNFMERGVDRVNQNIDDWVESKGDNRLVMAVGALGKAVIEVFVPTQVWELIPAGKGAKLLKKGAKATGVFKKGEKAAEATKDVKKASSKGSGGKVDGPKHRGPCDHLKQGSGKGPYRGGAHSKTRKPVNDGKDSHHIPAKDANPQLHPNDGPAIQMDPKDHARTSSNGQMAGSLEYREFIADLINNGKLRDAMAQEVKDVRRVAKEIKDPKKYNEALQEMLEYFKCLEKHGLIK